MNIYDVIVVGSGNAALCAALSAKDHGAKNILIIEKAEKKKLAETVDIPMVLIGLLIKTLVN